MAPLFHQISESENTSLRMSEEVIRMDLEKRDGERDEGDGERARAKKKT